MDSHAAQLTTLSIAVGMKLDNQLGDLAKRQTGHTEKINAQAATLHSLQNAQASQERRGGRPRTWNPAPCPAFRHVSATAARLRAALCVRRSGGPCCSSLPV